MDEKTYSTAGDSTNREGYLNDAQAQSAGNAQSAEQGSAGFIPMNLIDDLWPAGEESVVAQEQVAVSKLFDAETESNVTPISAADLLGENPPDPTTRVESAGYRSVSDFEQEFEDYATNKKPQSDDLIDPSITAKFPPVAVPVSADESENDESSVEKPMNSTVESDFDSKRSDGNVAAVTPVLTADVVRETPAAAVETVDATVDAADATVAASVGAVDTTVAAAEDAVVEAAPAAEASATAATAAVEPVVAAAPVVVVAEAAPAVVETPQVAPAATTPVLGTAPVAAATAATAATAAALSPSFDSGTSAQFSTPVPNAIAEEAEAEAKEIEERKLALAAEQMAAQAEAGEAEVEEEPIEQGISVITREATVLGDIITQGHIDIVGRVKGNIEAQGDVAIHGIVRGDVGGSKIGLYDCRVKGNLDAALGVIVDESSIIGGDVKTKNIIFDGKVKGNIDAENVVVLRSHSLTLGDVSAASLAVEPGAILNGTVKTLVDGDLEAPFEEVL